MQRDARPLDQTGKAPSGRSACTEAWYQSGLEAFSAVLCRSSEPRGIPDMLPSLVRCCDRETVCLP